MVARQAESNKINRMFDAEYQVYILEYLKFKRSAGPGSINVRSGGAKIPTEMNIGTNYKLQRSSLPAGRRTGGELEGIV